MMCIYPHPNPLPARERELKAQCGFTLLEMVLVLLIMGMVASLSIVFIDNEDGQLRYEESVQKLEAMHKATVNVKDYKDDFLFTGFVVDNGVLPNDAQNYISIPPDWISTGETYIDTTNPLNSVLKNRIQPYFRLTKKDLSTDIDYPAPDRGYTLFTVPNEVKGIYGRKGYRAGYISLGIDSAGKYKDAWGDDFIVNEVSGQLNLAIDLSGKADNTVSFIGDTDDNDISDINRNIPKDNWGITLSNLQIRITNNLVDISGDPVSITNPIIGIIIFNNKSFLRPNPSTGDETEICKECLKTYHFKKICEITGSTKQPVSVEGGGNISVFSSATENPIIWQTEALGKTEENQNTCDPTDSGYAENLDLTEAKNVTIPAGEHIVFVGEDADGDGKLISTDIKAQAILKAIPRATQSIVTLVIE